MGVGEKGRGHMCARGSDPEVNNPGTSVVAGGEDCLCEIDLGSN